MMLDQYCRNVHYKTKFFFLFSFFSYTCRWGGKSLYDPEIANRNANDIYFFLIKKLLVYPELIKLFRLYTMRNKNEFVFSKDD